MKKFECTALWKGALARVLLLPTEMALSPSELADVENTTLADIIRRNASIGAEISDDVFNVN